MNRLKTALYSPAADVARSCKTSWLLDIASGRVSVEVTGNVPLGQLYSQFAGLLLEDRDDGSMHVDVLRIFRDALNSQGWPENDESRTRKQIHIISSVRRNAKEDAGN